MRATKLLLCFLLVQLCISTAMAQWPSSTGTSNGRFWMETGASIFDRPGSDLGIPLVTNDVTKETLLDSDSLTDLNGAIGPNIKIGSTNRMGYDWEAGLVYGNWSTDHTIVGSDLTSPFLPANFFPDRINTVYDSEFFDFQFNFRRAILPGLTVLMGPRYFYLREQMDFSTNTIFNGQGGSFAFDTQNEVGTRNSAFGGTLGLEYNQPISQDIYLQGYGKASGLVNSATLQRSAQTTSDALTSSNFDKGTGMFIGQAGGRVYFDLVPRTISAYLGYEATIVDGVANAPSQQITVDLTDIKTTNSIFWHSYNFGLKFTY